MQAFANVCVVTAVANYLKNTKAVKTMNGHFLRNVSTIYLTTSIY